MRSLILYVDGFISKLNVIQIVFICMYLMYPLKKVSVANPVIGTRFYFCISFYFCYQQSICFNCVNFSRI